jgi:hypothetical protein
MEFERHATTMERQPGASAGRLAPARRGLRAAKKASGIGGFVRISDAVIRGSGMNLEGIAQGARA